MKKFWLVPVLLIGLCLFAAKSANAQTNYEDVVEKIHYTDPERRGGPDNHLLEALKETGSSNPILKAYIFGDLNGPYTKKFFDEIFDNLKNKYSTKVLFVYKHSPFMGQDKSVRAGMIGECAAAQNQFWINIRPIMGNLNDLENFGYLKNIDQAKLDKCLTEPLTKTLVIASGDDAKLFGLNGNPIMVIQNVSKPQAYSIKVNGAQDITIFERAFLEAEQGDLNKKDLEDIKSKVSELQQNVQQNQQDIKEVKVEQSRLAQELEKLKELIMSIIEQIKNLFASKSG